MTAKKISASLISTICFTFSCFSYANVDLSHSYNECISKPNITTQETLSCERNELKYQNNLLNKYYKQAMSDLPPSGKKELRKIELTWLKYRKEECGFYTYFTDGIIDEISENQCLLDKTASRADTLKNNTP